MAPVQLVGRLHIDPTRVGGAFSSRRHAFGVIPSSQPRPRPAQLGAAAAPPPPRRILAQAVMSAPQLSADDVAALQADLGPVVETLQLELEALKEEAEMVAPSTLRVQPDLYRSIQVIGPVFGPLQARSAILVASRAVYDLANRILTGTMGAYLSSEQKATVSTIAADAQALVRYVQQWDLQPLTGGAADLTQDFSDSHTRSTADLLAAVEKKAVAGEAGSVPVVEPSERGSAIGALIGVGVLVALGIIIAELT